MGDLGDAVVVDLYQDRRTPAQKAATFALGDRGLCCRDHVAGRACANAFVSVFVPHAIALLDRRYYLHLLQGPPMLHELLLWNAGSMALTFAISYF